MTAVKPQNDLPEPTAEEYSALKASIAERGVEYPIIVDHQGMVIDGRLRKRVCEELGINCPTTVISKLTASEKQALRFELNLCRRHINNNMKRQFATILLRRGPHLSDRAIGQQAGFDHKTIASLRNRMEGRGDIPQVETRIGKDHKNYRHPRITVYKSKDMKRAQVALRHLGSTAANGHMELRCAERKVRQRHMAVDRERAIVIPGRTDDIKILHGDFRKLDIPPDSVDAIFTDPPYPKEFMYVWPELSAFAARVLRPGGLLVTYSGQIYLDEVMAALGQHLKYCWQFILVHGGTNRTPIYPQWVYTRYKPILCFAKGQIEKHRWLDDVFHGTGKQKDLHEWQQNVQEAIYYIERLTKPGSLIVDPFGGSFTTAEAVLRLGDGRRFIGCDVDRAYVVRGQERLANVAKELGEVTK